MLFDKPKNDTLEIDRVFFLGGFSFFLSPFLLRLPACLCVRVALGERVKMKKKWAPLYEKNGGPTSSKKKVFFYQKKVIEWQKSKERERERERKRKKKQIHGPFTANRRRRCQSLAGGVG